jgi:hypothetical protein
LIEANYAALWGKEALTQLSNWQIAEHTITPLPLGIKRSLWDPLDVLLNPAVDSHGLQPVRPHFQAQKKAEKAPTPWDEFVDLPGVTKIVHFANGPGKVVFQAEDEYVYSTEYMDDFLHRARSVGETLGMGRLEMWSLNTDRYQAVGMRVSDGSIAVVRKLEVGLDDFEAAVASSVRPT